MPRRRLVSGPPVVAGPLVADVWRHLRARDARPRPEAAKPIRVTAQADGSTRVDLMDEIGFFGVTAQEFVDELLTIDTASIDLHVNSPGGDVFDGLAIMNALADHPATVNVIVDGLAASAAQYIALAGDTVKMNRGAQMMIHDAAGLCVGNAADMAEMGTLLGRISDSIAGILADRAGESVEFWRDLMRAETWYTGAEAVEAGLADVAVGGKADDDPPPRGGEEDEPAGEDPPEDPPPSEDAEAEALAARHRQVLAAFKYPSRAQAPAPKLHPTAVVQFNPADFRAAIREGVTS